MNTRENWTLRNLIAKAWRRESGTEELVYLAEVRCGSFWLPKVSKKCSHLIHNCSLSAPTPGLRLETGVKIDKKKTELYFRHTKKNS